MQLSGLQDNAILQIALAGSNAKAPYLPWRVSPGTPLGDNIVWQHNEIADYIEERARAQVRLRKNANRSGMTTADGDIRPTLIHESELARRGWRTNPPVSQVYTAQGVTQEEHDEKSIAAQIGRGMHQRLSSESFIILDPGPPIKRHRIRPDYGGEVTVVDDI
jgi:hypothetical protein